MNNVLFVVVIDIDIAIDIAIAIDTKFPSAGSELKISLIQSSSVREMAV